MKNKLFYLILLLIFSATVYPQGSVLTIDANAVLTVEANADICAGSKVVNGTIAGAGTWCSGVLPVELVSFKASVIFNQVILSWSTATETQNYGFQIERRTIGKDDWSAVGFVSGSGNSSAPKEYSFADQDVTSGRYSYRLRQIDCSGDFKYSQSIEITFLAPERFALRPNFPNPFNPSTVIRFELPEQSNVRLEIFDVLGKRVAELVNESKNAGYHEVMWTANASSGIYLCKITAGDFVQMRRMVLLK